MLFLLKTDVDKAYEILSKDGLIAFPTETVYGLGILATSSRNYQRLVEVKKRTPDKPFTLMFSKIEQVEKYLQISLLARNIIKEFMPGALTLILKAAENVPYFLDLGTGFIGIRMSDDPFVLELIDRLDQPLLVPSANISTFPPALNEGEVYNYFQESIDAIIIGAGKSNIPSTVLKIDGDHLTILREGSITLKEIMEVTKWK